MSIRLTVRQRSEANSQPTEVILDEPSILLGRDKTCQVVLAQQAVSRTHARISRDGPLFFLEDLGSSYGTEVNGKRLPRGEKRLLRNGDVIVIAQFDVTFDRLAEVPREGQSDKTAFVARAVVKDVMRGLGSGEGPYFRIMNGPREGERIELSDAQELVFGRDDTADVVFKGDDLISRRHAKVRRDWSGTHVEDLDSRNGIRVNKKKTPRRTLRDRDELEIGGVRLLYLDPTEVRETPVVLPEEHGDPTENPDASLEQPSASMPDESSQASEVGSSAALEASAGEGASGASDDGADAAEPPSDSSGYDPGSGYPEEPEPPSRLASLLPPGLLEDRSKLAALGALGVLVLLALVLVIGLFV